MAVGIDLQTGSESTSTDWKRTLHVYGMIVSWGVLAPVGVLIARFGRDSHGKFTPTTMRMHVWCQSAVVLGTAGALVLGFLIGSGQHRVHEALGIGIASAAGLQFIVAHLARPKPDAP